MNTQTPSVRKHLKHRADRNGPTESNRRDENTKWGRQTPPTAVPVDCAVTPDDDVLPACEFNAGRGDVLVRIPLARPENRPTRPASRRDIVRAARGA